MTSAHDGPHPAQVEGGKRLAAVLHTLADDVAPGKPTSFFDERARVLLREHKGIPAFLDYRGYPSAVCVSVNDEVVHGIPSSKRILQEGDIVSLDLGLVHKGWYVDMAVTIPVGTVSSAAIDLIDTTRDALQHAIDVVRPGIAIGDIGHAVQSFVEKRGYGIVRSLVGHGIGKKLHEPPQVPNFGTPGTGEHLKIGDVIAIEPMVTASGYEVEFLDDGWTARTKDRSLSAHFEKTVAVTAAGVQVLTD